MATTEPPEKKSVPTVTVQQEQINGGVGVKIESAHTVIMGVPLSKLRRLSWLMISLALLASALVFAADIAGVQQGLCRLTGLRGACAVLGLGHLPSVEEEQAWAALSGDADCEGLRTYLTRWPRGEYVTEASARLAARTTEEHTVWVAQPSRLPIFVSEGETFSSEAEARQDFAQRGAEAAKLACEFYAQSALHRVDSASAECAPEAASTGGWRCPGDGKALCDLQVAHAEALERCAVGAP